MDKFLKREVLETSSSDDSDTDDSGSDSSDTSDSESDVENSVQVEQVDVQPIGNTARKQSSKKKTSRQIGILEAAYREDPTKPQRGTERIQKLMESTKLERCRIQQWFGTRRNRDRKKGILKISAETSAGKRVCEKALPGSSLCWKTPEQLKVLVAAYEEDPSPLSINSARAKKLGDATGLDVNDIAIWFTSRRRREKGKKTDKTPTGIQPEQFKVLRDAFEEDQNFVYKNTARADKLVAATGLHIRYIQQWFRQSRKTIGAAPTEFRKTPEQLEALRAAYELDPEVPALTRMEKLCAETGLGADKIAGWFGNQRMKYKAPKSCKYRTEEELKILRAAYAIDPSVPGRNSARLKKILEATGLQYNVVQDWFRGIKRRRRNKNGGNSEEVPEQQVEDANTENIPSGVVEQPASTTPDDENDLTDNEEDQEGTSNRKKTRKTPEQLEVLWTSFEKDPSIPVTRSDRMNELCSATGLQWDVIKSWFSLTWQNIRNGQPKSKYILKTPEQIEILYAAYIKDPTIPEHARMKALCASSGLNSKTIKYWFGKVRKMSKAKVEEQYGKESTDKMKAWEEKVKNIIEKVKLMDRNDPNKKAHTSRFQKRGRDKGADGLNNDSANVGDDSISTPSINENCSDQDVQNDVATKEESSERPADTKPLLCGSLPAIVEDQESQQEKTTKCPICDCVPSSPVMSVASINEAKKMDKYFDSSLVHFLVYTCAVKVCMSHIQECRGGVGAS